MVTSLESIANLRVEQVMARDVVTVFANDTMGKAAKLLKAYGVTGLPVVDGQGRCVGVLSTSDFVNPRSEENATHSPIAEAATTLDHTGIAGTQVLDKKLVRAYMSPRVRTIREYLPIVEAGRMMCQEHIHRLIVVDRQGRPIGVISSLDLVSAIVHAAES